MIICAKIFECSISNGCAHAKPHSNEDCYEKGMGEWFKHSPCNDICDACKMPEELVTGFNGFDACVGCVCKPVEEMQRKLINHYFGLIGDSYQKKIIDDLSQR
jgi:hypothetical protein